MANQKEQRHTLAGKVMEDLMVETLATFFLLRAAGTKIGAVKWKIYRYHPENTYRKS